jgi:hypothetical protein
MRLKHRKIGVAVLAAVALVCAALLAACGGTSSAPPASAPAQTQAPPASSTPINSAPATTYLAASPDNTLADGADIQTDPGVDLLVAGYIGMGGTVTFNGITVPSTGTYNVVISCVLGPPSRSATVSANDGPTQTINFVPTTWNQVSQIDIQLSLNAGSSSITFGNPDGWAPDFYAISVG